MPMQLGTGIKPNKGAVWAQAIAPVLLPRETIRVLVRGSAVGMTEDLVAITDLRVLGTQTAYHCRIRSEIPLREITAAEDGNSLRGTGVRLTMRSGKPRRIALAQAFGTSDQELVLAEIRNLLETGTPMHLREAVAADERQRAESRERAQLAEQGLWPNSIVIGSRPRRKAAASILAHAAPGEEPWLIISSPDAGVLVAFDDRLVLIKTGWTTSALAGSFGGQRAATFNFHDVTGIEYNSGLINGVLEILTPSYDGTANRDFWRGSNRSRNADSNDPFTLSNTLPLDKATHSQAQPHLNELRRRITAFKRTVSVDGYTPAPAPEPDTRLGTGLADELGRLASLRDSGVLTDEEFQSAKARLLRP